MGVSHHFIRHQVKKESTGKVNKEGNYYPKVKGGIN